MAETKEEIRAENEPVSVSAELASAIRKKAIEEVAKYAVGAFVVLAGFALSGWLFYLQAALPGVIGSVPVGAVVAFDLREKCPRGWDDFSAADGRFIVGTGKADGSTKAKSFGETAGHDSITIKLENMPKHQHDTVLGYDMSGAVDHYGVGDRKKIIFGGSYNVATSALTAPAGREHPDEIETDPPYLALRLCKKN